MLRTHLDNSLVPLHRGNHPLPFYDVWPSGFST